MARPLAFLLLVVGLSIRAAEAAPSVRPVAGEAAGAAVRTGALTAALGPQAAAAFGLVSAPDWLGMVAVASLVLVAAVVGFVAWRRPGTESPIPLIVDLAATEAATADTTDLEPQPSPASFDGTAVAAPTNPHAEAGVPDRGALQPPFSVAQATPAFARGDPGAAGLDAAEPQLPEGQQASAGLDGLEAPADRAGEPTTAETEAAASNAAVSPAPREDVEGAEPLPLLDFTSRVEPRPVREALPLLPLERPGSVPAAAEALPLLVRDEPAADRKRRNGEQKKPPVAAGELSSGGLLQLLPGALEITGGMETGPALRFFRTSAAVEPEVTFGRDEGPEYRHVHLPLPAVSRVHARMVFREGRWRITNLSDVNPVRVNGRELAERGEEWSLVDGDRIEIGPVSFRYQDPRA